MALLGKVALGQVVDGPAVAAAPEEEAHGRGVAFAVSVKERYSYCLDSNDEAAEATRYPFSDKVTRACAG